MDDEPPACVSRITESGWTLVATRDIFKGEEILCERPLVCGKHYYLPTHDGTEAGFIKFVHSREHQLVHSHVHQLLKDKILCIN